MIRVGVVSRWVVRAFGKNGELVGVAMTCVTFCVVV